MQQISETHNAWSAIAGCLVGMLINKLLEFPRIQKLVIAHTLLILWAMLIIDGIVELVAISYPVVYIIGGHAIFTAINELYDFILRWYRNRLWVDPERRTRFEVKTNTWCWVATLIGGIIGLIPVPTIYVPLIIGIFAYCISTISMHIITTQIKYRIA